MTFVAGYIAGALSVWAWLERVKLSKWLRNKFGWDIPTQ